jgi:hypothetical protein
MAKKSFNVGYLTDYAGNCDICVRHSGDYKTFVLRRRLPDWSRTMDLSERSMLTSAKSCQLRHFEILEIEFEGVHAYKLLEVGSDRIDKVLSVLDANLAPVVR